MSQIDLRDFPYIPLYIHRLQKSRAWLLCKREPALAFYMVNLWVRSWHEVPCGSLEDDDDVLADAAMCDPKTWEKVKERVLRGWKRESGRVYHNVVAEVAQESWDAKQKQRQRTEAARQARSQARGAATTGNVTSSVTDSVTSSVTESKGREGKGLSEEEKKKAASAAALRCEANVPSIRDVLFRDGPPIIVSLIGCSDSQAKSFLGKMLKNSHEDCAAVNALLWEAKNLNPADPKAWLMRASIPRAERGMFDQPPPEPSPSNPLGHRITPLGSSL